MGGCRQFSSGVVLCKYPTVVFITDFSVRHGGGITQKYVLAKVVADDSPVETSQCQVAVDYRKGAVLYLLQQVILTVGLVDFRHTVYLVDGSHVEIRVESFVGQCQDIGFSGLGFDAGDYDLRVESQAGEAYILAMACENFGAYWDETSIDFEKKIVEIHQPDGKNDLLQQVENGALTIVAGWKALGRLYRGILCPTVRQYAHLGDASAHTDHVSGTADDRWVFTEDNPGRELQVAAWLAGISRVLKGHNDALGADCLEIARELFRITRCDNNRVLTAKVHAAVELYLATKEVEYRDFVLQQQDFICKNIRQTGWFIGRFDKAVGNARFSKAVRKALPELQAMYQEYSSKTPYGVPHDRGNRSSGSWEPQHLGYNYCYLHAAYPDLFAPDYIFNAVQYLLGMHPGRNQAAFVTGVGAETVKAAYGVNRADWSYIPGGVSPGTNLIRPDLPELLHFPFLWQEGEYCLGGHATWFMYMVLASQKILNGNEQ